MLQLLLASPADQRATPEEFLVGGGQSNRVNKGTITTAVEVNHFF